ncbi:MAG: insulinase family protein [Candidatus Vogelbacteria bacterium]|nr:insulinase family protein [Candidatus Vogelbacteria bacterium]
MQYIKKILSNGLRVIAVPEADSLAATILVLVEAGSKYESKDVNGLSHFLEHMCFKGTKSRPRAIDITSELDSLGAQYNAFTGHEYTGYYAKVQARYFDKALDIVSDLYLNPVFDEKEIEKEKGVVVEEINMYEDLPQRKVEDLIIELLYGDQPAGWPITGPIGTVQSLKKENFTDYRGKHYVASATTVIIAGKFDQKTIFKKVGEKFKDMSKSKKHGKIRTIDKQIRPKVLLRHKASDQTHLVLGFRTYNAYDKRNYALEVLAGALGGSMSSRLFQRVREDMGAAYYVRSANDSFTDHGYLEIGAGVDNKRAVEVIVAILDEIKKIRDKGLSSDELQMVKDSISGNTILGLETSDAKALFYGGQDVLKKKIIDPEEYIKNVQKVTGKELLRVAKEIFKNSNLNLAIIGPFEQSEVFARILSL